MNPRSIPYFVMVLGWIAAQVLLVLGWHYTIYYIIIWGLASLIYVLRDPDFLGRRR